MVEGLFVGLVMMCLDSDHCGGEEKALLVNATVERCGEGGCTVCGGPKIALHRPRLYVHMSDVVSTTAPLTQCDSVSCGGGGVFYWDLLGREICFNVGPEKARREPGRAHGDRDPMAAGASDKAFDWIPSMTRFHQGFDLSVDLTPGDADPVAASVDLGPGNLHAERLGKWGNSYSHWKAAPDTDADPGDFPRALAEAIVWRPRVQGRFLTVSDCHDRGTEVVLDQQRNARFIVANLPEPCSAPGPLKKLLHFGAYYELSSASCAVPELVDAEEPPQVQLMDFGEWLTDGDFVAIGCPMPNIETTLCPPSKFP